MTNKQFKKHRKNLFNCLTKSTQRTVRHLYAMDELNFCDTKARDFSFQTMKKEKHWPRIYRQYAGSKTRKKIYTWNYNNYILPEWRQAHFEIVDYILDEKQQEKSGLVKNIYDDTNYSSSIRLSELATIWANKFTSTYINYDWDKDGDYYEKIIDFCNEENQQIEQYNHI